MDLFLFHGPRILLLRACTMLAKSARAVSDILGRFWKPTNSHFKFLKLKLEIQYYLSCLVETAGLPNTRRLSGIIFSEGEQAYSLSECIAAIHAKHNCDIFLHWELLQQKGYQTDRFLHCAVWISFCTEAFSSDSCCKKYLIAPGYGIT